MINAPFTVMKNIKYKNFMHDIQKMTASIHTSLTKWNFSKEQTLKNFFITCWI